MNPLKNLTDAQLKSKWAFAMREARRGAAVLGPFSIHAIDIELSRRRMAGKQPESPAKGEVDRIDNRGRVKREAKRHGTRRQTP